MSFKIFFKKYERVSFYKSPFTGTKHVQALNGRNRVPFMQCTHRFLVPDHHNSHFSTSQIAVASGPCRDSTLSSPPFEFPSYQFKRTPNHTPKNISSFGYTQKHSTTNSTRSRQPCATFSTWCPKVRLSRNDATVKRNYNIQLQPHRTPAPNTTNIPHKTTTKNPSAVHLTHPLI